MDRHQQSALADAMLGAGATLLLLYTTSNERGLISSAPKVALVAGILLVFTGIAFLWGTPRPDLRTRMLASVAGLFIGFGLAVFGTPGAWVALPAGALLFFGVWRAIGKRR